MILYKNKAMTEALKSQVLEVINAQDGFSLETLNAILEPIQKYAETSKHNFISNAGELAHVIVKDRNGDNVFSIDDLELLATDIGAITELVKGILLLVISMRDLNFKYVPGVAEAIVLKALMYVFLVLIPIEMDVTFSQSEQRQIVDVTMAVYKVAVASKIVERAAGEVIQWFQRKNLCLCCVVQNDTQSIVEDNIPVVASNLQASLEKNRKVVVVATKSMENRAKYTLSPDEANEINVV